MFHCTMGGGGGGAVFEGFPEDDYAIRRRHYKECNFGDTRTGIINGITNGIMGCSPFCRSAGNSSAFCPARDKR